MTRSSRALAAAIAALAAAACVASPLPPGGGASPGPRASVKPSAGPKAATPTPGARPGTPTPAATATAGAPTAGPAGLPPARLIRPTSGTRPLAGRIDVDARYAIGVAGAQVISNNGSSVVAVGGADILGKIRLISDYQGGVSGGRGGNLISNNGGGIVGKIRSASGILSDMGASYRLTQADAAPPAAKPAYGDVAPTAGMLTSVLGLERGELLPLGEDAAGKPVYEVYSDLAGRFEVDVPADVKGALLVLARAPGAEDPRLSYNLVVPEGGATAEGVVDEDTSRATDYVRLACARSLQQYLEPEAAEPERLDIYDVALAEAARLGRARLFEAGRAVHGWPAPARAALAERLGSLVLARLDLASARMDSEGMPYPYTGPDMPAFDGIVATLRAYRGSAAAKMREIEASGQDPTAYFKARPYFVNANQGRARPIEVRKPMDFCDFFIARFVATSDPLRTMVSEDAQAANDDVFLSADETVRYAAAYRGLRMAVTRSLYTGPSPTVDEVVAMIRATPAP